MLIISLICCFGGGCLLASVLSQFPELIEYLTQQQGGTSHAGCGEEKAEEKTERAPERVKRIDTRDIPERIRKREKGVKQKRQQQEMREKQKEG